MSNSGCRRLFAVKIVRWNDKIVRWFAGERGGNGEIVQIEHKRKGFDNRCVGIGVYFCSANKKQVSV